MAGEELSNDSKLKLAAGVYGDTVTNGDVENPPPPGYSYTPGFAQGQHQKWIEDLLSGVDGRIKQALRYVAIEDGEEQNKVIRAFPKSTDLHVALAVYKKLQHDLRTHHTASAVDENDQPPALSGSHDY
jgi:hypothetical protein